MKPLHIALCLDYSSFTQKVIDTVQKVAARLQECDITVIHIIDETLFAAGAGYEMQLDEDLKMESKNLEQLCIAQLGEKISYIEEYGIPRQKIDEILSGLDYDFLVIGSHSKSILGALFLGSEAEHLLLHSKKPVLVIP